MKITLDENMLHLDRRSMFRRETGAPVSLLVATAVMLTSVLSVACDPTYTIKFTNTTDRPVTILLDGKVDAHVGPHESRTFDTLTWKGAMEFSAVDEAGVVLYRANLTADDLRAMGWTILIE